MPSYQYTCQDCGPFTVIRSVTVNGHPDCPTCHGPGRRVFTPVGVMRVTAATAAAREPRVVRRPS